jgi:hypothetical protein
MPDNYTAEEQRNLDLAKKYISISYDPKRTSADAARADVPPVQTSAAVPSTSFTGRPILLVAMAANVG